MIGNKCALHFALLSSFAGVAAAQCSGTSSQVNISSLGTGSYQSVAIPVTCSSSGTISAVTVTFNNLKLTGDSLNLDNLGIVLLYQLSSPSITKDIDFLDAVDTVTLNTSYYLTFSDSASSFVPNQSGTIEAGSSGSPTQYKPTDYGVANFPDSFPFPIGSITTSNGAGCGTGPSVCTGTATFTNTFGGLTTAEVSGGTWTVYIGDFQGSTSGIIGSIALNFTVSAGSSTTTSLVSGTNPSFTSGTSSSDTLTATVTSGGGTVSAGTVSFFEDGNALTCTGGNQTVSNGSATCTVVFATQGTHTLLAEFNGGGSFAASGFSNSVTQVVDGHTTLNGTTLCNTGSIAIPNGVPTSGTAAAPYPSNLILGGSEPTLAGIIQKLTLTLTGLDYGFIESTGMVLVAPGAGGAACTSNCTAFEFLSNAGGDSITSAINVTFDDDASASIPGQLASAGTFKPTSAIAGNPPGDGYPSPAPQTFNQAAPNGSATFLSEFGGLGLSGTWTLYVSNRGSNGTPGTINGGWCLNLTMDASADGTSTTVSGTPNPQTTGSQVTITATVTDTSHTSTTVNAGSVIFTDGSTTLGTMSVASGTATLNTSSLTEGTHHILASYSGGTGAATFGVSSGSFDLRINNAPTVSGTGPYTFCNTGSIAVPASAYLIGAAGPYPSNIMVSNLPGTVDALTVSLKNFTANSLVDDLGSLLVAPNGANLDFFSNAGGTGDLLSPVNLTFQDGASRISGTPTSGTFGPTSISPKDSYPACPQNATDCTSPAVGPPMTVTSFNYAPTDGTSSIGSPTAAGIFGGTSASTFNGNGQWSLFMVAPTENQGNITISGGWCMNFTENPVTVTVGRNYGSFEQGQSGSIQITVTNSGGPGPTGDPTATNPMKVVDTLPTGFTPGTPSGTNWSCQTSGQVVTCTNDSPVGESSAYPTLTIPVTVSGTEGASASNQVTSSGAGTTPTSNTDGLTIEATTTTAASNATATFSSTSQSVMLTASVTDSIGTVNTGTVTFSVFNGGTQIGSSTAAANVTNGTASASYTLPGNTAGGAYSIHASYSGTSSLAASSDNTHTLTVNPAGTTTSASNQTASFSSSAQSVMLSATVTSSAGTVNEGTVTFTLINASSQTVGSATTSVALTTGSATVNYTLPASTPIGTYTIQAVYNASTNFATSTDTSHTLTISGGTTVTASNATATYSPNNQSVMLTTAVTSAAGTVNAGTVIFTVFNGGTQLGSATSSVNVTNGSASATYTLPGATNAATYTIVASYTGAGGFTSASDNTHTLTVNPAGTTTMASNQSASFSSSAQSVMLSAAVTSSAGTVNAGTVTFTLINASSQPVGTATTSVALTTGSASVNYTLPASTPIGSYTIQAVYNASTNFATSTDTTHTLIISGGTTVAAFSASATYSSSNQPVTLTTSVTSGAGTVNAGSVIFTVFNGATQLGSPTASVNVTNGSASATYTLPGATNSGTYIIVASYTGAGGFTSASDNTHTLTVSQAGTTTTASNQTASFNASSQIVPLSATVTSSAGTVNAGTVTFTLINGSSQTVGSATTSVALTTGSASVNYTLPANTPVGSYTIQAVYNASTNFTTSNDSSHTLVISGGSTTTASNAMATYSPSSQVVALSAGVTGGSGTVNNGMVTFTVLNVSTPVGTPVTGNVSGGIASVNYTLPGGTPAGTYTIQAVYSGGTLTGSSDSTHTLTVGKATPVVSWSTPASITFGSALSGEQLNATASVGGTFVYTPPAGTVLPVGNSQTLSVQFTPTDTMDYNGAPQTVSINVTAASSPATLVSTETLARDPNTGDVIVTLTVANTGGSPATSVQVNSAAIGGAAPITTLPLAMANVPGGGSSSVTLTFPSSVGTSGSRAVLSISGTYSGGSFGGSSRVVLP